MIYGTLSQSSLSQPSELIGMIVMGSHVAQGSGRQGPIAASLCRHVGGDAERRGGEKDGSTDINNVNSINNHTTNSILMTRILLLRLLLILLLLITIMIV